LIETDSDTQRRKLEALQAQLATRASILHFTHAVISGFIACAVSLATLRLAREGQGDLHAWSLRLTLFLWLYAAIRGVAGFRARRVEEARFAELIALRKSLHLDNPSVLLPR